MTQTTKIAERFSEVRAKLGLTQQQLADKLFVSQNYIAQLEGGRKTKPSAALINGLERLANPMLGSIDQSTMREAPAPYFASASRQDSDPLTMARRAPVQLNPSYSLPAEQPTDKHCQAYFAEYLQRAKQVPGAIGHTWVELTAHFPLTRFPPIDAPK
jgi:transcriptional regulator with XRE-family HTH domain